MTDTNGLAERVRWLIRCTDGSVNAARQRIGLKQQTLNRIARGDIANPHPNSLRVISEGYGVSLAWLVYGEGDAPDPFPAYCGVSDAELRSVLTSHGKGLVWRLAHALATSRGLAP